MKKLILLLALLAFQCKTKEVVFHYSIDVFEDGSKSRTVYRGPDFEEDSLALYSDIIEWDLDTLLID